MTDLCENCRQIPFSALACPTASEIHKARQAAKNKRFDTALPFSETSDADRQHIATKDVPLGFLSRIRRDKDHCALCGLFYHVIQNRQQKEPPGINRTVYFDDDDNVFCSVGVGPFAWVAGPHGDSIDSDPDVFFPMSRLFLQMHLREDDNIDDTRIPSSIQIRGLYWNVAQACHMDEFEHKSQFTLEARADGQRMLCSGRKRPDTIDLDLLRSWITICTTDHENTCCYEKNPSGSSQSYSYDSNPPSETSIRFIDVKRNNLTDLRSVNLSLVKYAALSYTWGAAKQVKLERDNNGQDNEAELRIEGALKRVKLPQTIADAIYVARELGFEYLWVDALCVRQGQHPSDQEDRVYQLSNMGTIYRQAFLTIVAASGQDANAGLMGLRPESRPKQRVVEVIPRDSDNDLGMALVTTCDCPPVYYEMDKSSVRHDNELEASYWNERGWTFQERALSRRSLVFTKEQVSWVCDGAIFCEESRFEHPERLCEPKVLDTPLRIELWKLSGSPMSWKTIDGPLARATFNQQDLWTKYQDAILAFTRRNFSFQGDVYDAFRGITGALERMYGETFHLGLLRSRFECSFFWYPDRYRRAGIYRLTDKDSGKMASVNQQAILPSWSWMGWVGAVRLRSVESGAGVVKTNIEICCYEIRGSDLALHPVHGTDDTDLEGREDSGELTDPKRPRAVKDLATPDQRSLWRGVVTWSDVEKECPALTAFRVRGIPDGHLLFFWASTATFVVENLLEPPGAMAPRIRNLKNQKVGNLNMEPRPTPFLPRCAQVVWRKGTDLLGRLHREPTSALGRCVAATWTVADFFQHRGPWRASRAGYGPHEFVVIGSEQYPGRSHVLVLQIRWEDGIAYRVNIGKILTQSWLEANPVWKLIPLM